MTTEFDKLINERLVTRKLLRKIARLKKKTNNRKDSKITPPNTPGHTPASNNSPSSVSGNGTDVAQASMGV